MALVMDTGGSCLLPSPTSVCIGRTDNSYSCNANVTPLELSHKCSKKHSLKITKRDICNDKGYPKATWHVTETSQALSRSLHLSYLFIIFYILA